MPPTVALLAAAMSGLLAASLVFLTFPPRRSVRSRVMPYLRPGSTGIGETPGSTIGRVYLPLASQAAAWLAGLVDNIGGEVTLARVRQAAWFPGITEEGLLGSYRALQLRNAAFGLGTGIVAGLVLRSSPASTIALGTLGLFIGISRQKGRLEKAIEQRRELMRIEIYTINQLLAMRVRAGGGVIQAVSGVVERGTGEVVAELAQALRLHRGGWRASDAFRRIAELSPEPYCSRTYRLLASAEERGVDLAGALLALSEDVRESRRESIKRSATKRRAAMLIPTIAILAPVLIIFVAAPLPSLITGWQ